MQVLEIVMLLQPPRNFPNSTVHMQCQQNFDPGLVF